MGMTLTFCLSPRSSCSLVSPSLGRNRVFVVQAGLVPIMVKYLLAVDENQEADYYLRDKATTILRNLGGEDDALLEKDGIKPP